VKIYKKGGSRVGVEIVTFVSGGADTWHHTGARMTTTAMSSRGLPA
jgi:hypothetical protein